jgi:hypothetical protein
MRDSQVNKCLRVLPRRILGETYIMAIMYKTAEEKQQQQQAKNGYWQNELCSLGTLETEQNKKGEVEDNKAGELEDPAGNIKQTMFQNYKLAYSEEGDTYKEEAQSTVTVG